MLATAAVAVIVVVLAAGTVDIVVIVGTAGRCIEPAPVQGLQLALQLHTRMAVGSLEQHRTDTTEDFVAVLHQRPPHSVHKHRQVAAFLSEHWRYEPHPALVSSGSYIQLVLGLAYRQSLE